MINAITVNVDVATIDPTLALRLMGQPLEPGITRQIPGGLLAFQSSTVSTSPADPSLYQFVLQIGTAQGATMAANWLFTMLRDAAAALLIAGRVTPIDHHAIVTSLRQAA